MPLSVQAWLQEFTQRRRGFGYSKGQQRSRHIHFQVMIAQRESGDFHCRCLAVADTPFLPQFGIRFLLPST